MKAALSGFSAFAYRGWLFWGTHARPMVVRIRPVKTVTESVEYRTQKSANDTDKEAKKP
jgi:hypothetical protein